jgi:hypothetical protein
MDVLIYDCETMQEMFLVGIYDPQTELYFEFEVSSERNDLDAFMRFAEAHVEHH